jgi:hypothetical protein
LGFSSFLPLIDTCLRRFKTIKFSTPIRQRIQFHPGTWNGGTQQAERNRGTGTWQDERKTDWTSGETWNDGLKWDQRKEGDKDLDWPQATGREEEGDRDPIWWVSVT